MTREVTLLNDIRRMNAEFIQLTGREAYGYVSQPTPTTPRIVFQDQHVCLSMHEAHAYMATLLALAQNDPSTLPYPFDQELTPAQDLRTRKA
jgi:hypothetical protein